MKTYLTEIRKKDGLYAGEEIKANSFAKAEAIALTKKPLTRVIGEFIFEIKGITNLDADNIINELNKRK